MHPKNGPSAQRGAPVKGKLQSTAPYRESLQLPILGEFLSQITSFQIMPHTLSSGLGMTKDLTLNHASDLDQLQYKPDRTGCGMTTITGHCGNLAQNNYDEFYWV